MNDNIFMKIVEDRFEKFQRANCLMVCDFMSLEQQSMLSGFIRTHKRDGAYLYGGYPDAERKMVVFLPDYMVDEIRAWLLEVKSPDANETANSNKADKPLTDEELCQWFSAHPDECPLQILDCEIPAHEKAELSHRDYLGALMGEGIKREKVGDILVRSQANQGESKSGGAQIIVMNDMADYLLENYRQVGRATLNTKLAPISELSLGEIRTKDENVNVASPRLDNIVAEVFHMSRKLAQEAISHGIVFVDGIQMNKPDFTMKGGEKLVLRGKGKIIYHGIVGQSRKGNDYVRITRYL